MVLLRAMRDFTEGRVDTPEANADRNGAAVAAATDRPNRPPNTPRRAMRAWMMVAK
jgi:hypothetical protein